MEEQRIISALEVYDVDTGERRTLKEIGSHIEAPNWTPDGKTLVYNSKGGIYTFDLATGRCGKIDTGKCIWCNNDHVLSPKGDMLAISAGTAEDRGSRVWILPISGGEPRLITPLKPSYLHGWSPDSKTLAYCAERGGEYDIYTMPAEGGDETRLTDAPGLSDGPEYSPDGAHIWFNSVRSGLMQVYRMGADGTDQKQMTFSSAQNAWFPHISPDGKHVVYLCYRRGDVEPHAHPANKDVEIWMMQADGARPRKLFELFGGQGTINVNSWAPDGKRFAFVSYRFVTA